MKRKKNRKYLWVTVILILVVLAGYGINWGYKRYQAVQKEARIEKKLVDLRAAHEANPDDIRALMKYAIALHDYDNPERLEESIQIFKKVMELDPDNPTAIGYYGSALTKKANYLESIPDKVETLQEGLDVMDKNVSDHPDNFAARMIRAENNYYLPSMFNRIGISVNDFEYLLGMTRDGNYTSMIPYLKLRLGQSYIKAERISDAKKILQELIDEYPDDDNAKKARQILKDLR